MFIGAVVLIGGLLCSCSGSSSKTSEGTTVASTVAPTTTTTLPLTERVQKSWEGVQLDVIGKRAIPGATTLFFQKGDWAAEALLKDTTTWCLANEYRWHVTSATDPTHFVAQYDRIRTYPTCAATDDKKLVVKVNGAHQVNGKAVYDIRYTVPSLNAPTTRTVCASSWDSTDRCGLTTTGLNLPAAPSA
jgi:hypothetical protein